VEPVSPSQPRTPDLLWRVAIRDPAISAPALESVATSAFAALSLGSSLTEVAGALLGLFGLAIIVYVAIPVLKTLGTCWSALIHARLVPSNQQRGNRRRRRKQSVPTSRSASKPTMCRCPRRERAAPSARSVAWCSASVWSVPDGSGLLRLGASSVQTDRKRSPSDRLDDQQMIRRPIATSRHPRSTTAAHRDQRRDSTPG
jgi:hypothetical protein